MAASSTTKPRGAKAPKDKPDEAPALAAESNGAGEWSEPDPSLGEQAKTIRGSLSYDGSMTPKLLVELEPLLAAPLNPRYIEHTPPLKGKPYASTGVRSVQVQVDRLNEVLGAAHWRVLYHYANQGQLCKAVLIVGNDLHRARLDEAGELVPFVEAGSVDAVGQGVFHAEILATREGWGGHAQGRSTGDYYKGSETNALKRVIARIGPGSEVYRLDFDDDVNLANEADAPAMAARPARQAQPHQAAPDPEAELAALLGEDSPLAAKRETARKGMTMLGSKAPQILRELRAAADERQLDGLIARIGTALDAAGTGEDVPPDDPGPEAEQPELGEAGS